jgi:anti-sigma factor RsiW
MNCRAARGRLSRYLDQDLSTREARELVSHLATCRPCARRWASLRRAVEALADAPRLESPEPIAGMVLARLEMESRGPGLASLLRPGWSHRPFMLPSLVPAVLVLVTILGAFLGMQQEPRPLTSVVARGEAWHGPLPPSGSEANPLFPSSEVSAPRVHTRAALGDVRPTDLDEHTFFLETVVARDGSVSDVTVLGGDREAARPFVDALLRERFEPGLYRGQPVAVCVYRLISHVLVRAS